MSFQELPIHVQHRIRHLHATASDHAQAGHSELAGAITSAADALLRGDEVSAENWLEKADFEQYIIRTSA